MVDDCRKTAHLDARSLILGSNEDCTLLALYKQTWSHFRKNGWNMVIAERAVIDALKDLSLHVNRTNFHPNQMNFLRVEWMKLDW